MDIVARIALQTNTGCVGFYWLGDNVDIVSYPDVSIRSMPEAAKENQNWLK